MWIVSESEKQATNWKICNKIVLPSFRFQGRHFPGNRTVGEVVGRHVNKPSLSAASFFPLITVLRYLHALSLTDTRNSNNWHLNSYIFLYRKTWKSDAFRPTNIQSQTRPHIHTYWEKALCTRALYTHTHTHTQTLTLKHAAVCFGRVRHWDRRGSSIIHSLRSVFHPLFPSGKQNSWPVTFFADCTGHPLPW